MIVYLYGQMLTDDPARVEDALTFMADLVAVEAGDGEMVLACNGEHCEWDPTCWLRRFVWMGQTVK